MSLKVKFGGPLVRFKPDNATGNTVDVDTNEGLSLVTLLQQFNIPKEQRLLTILNGAVIHADAYANTRLSNGDELSLMPPIQAG